MTVQETVQGILDDTFTKFIHKCINDTVDPNSVHHPYNRNGRAYTLNALRDPEETILETKIREFQKIIQDICGRYTNPFWNMVSCRSSMDQAIEKKVNEMRRTEIPKFDPYISGPRIFLTRPPRFMQ